MKKVKRILAPTKREKAILRFMICSGIVYMFFFIGSLLNTGMVTFALLYWLFMFVIVFNCAKFIHEWIHYLFITVPQTPPVAKTYSVDIFTTFCAGEPYEMIVETLHAIKAIKYPHETYLCDEANDPYLKNLCTELGVHHITRTNKIDAKAGNINNALKQSSGELCVVLDPDHVPFPDFLDPIVSFFDNPKIGFVQIVQAYKNYAGGLIAKGAAQQTFQFYGPIMMTMNRYGTVLAIGANCTFRRKALESIGGHAAGLAEDMHTAMQLHAAGWKSVYVPEVLARGLVPDTLSAYYSQQLKWARGVFELLVTSYPKLFRKFTWQQKLHYGLIPLYYLSGVVFLMNFMIPIVSLFFNISPINIDLVSFGILGFPLLSTVILVRHYVQKWVMEDQERGFHFVGGLLMIGTWWIFIVGLIYTIIRKKVPYIPTPKDSQEENNWRLNIPNIIVIIVSLCAAVYGLQNDWSPYTLIMSGFALTNCLILSFTIAASRQQQFRRFKMRNKLVFSLMRPVSYVKNTFWKTRHKAYNNSHRWILPVHIFIGLILVGFVFIKRDEAGDIGEEPATKKLFLSGIFSPVEANGISVLSEVEKYERQYDTRFDIVSVYLSWGDIGTSKFPKKTLDSITQRGSVPMLTWEPWQTLFEQNQTETKEKIEKKVFKKITEGVYDQYLTDMTNEIKSLRHPLYLRFAHEADNPSYPWSSTGENTPKEFIQAWRYVHQLFKKQKVNNVMWVWNPWKSEAVNTYFPGNDFVDWIGVTNLNYGTMIPGNRQYSMSALYQPFHNKAIFRSGIPVMLAEMGTLSGEADQDAWFKDAFQSIRTKYPEIKAFVLFNNGYDQNTLDKREKAYDWRYKNKTLNTFDLHSPKYITTGSNVLNSTPVKRKTKGVRFPTDIKGVNYNKGKTWLLNNTGLTKREIEKDFVEMKKLGVNAIKWSGMNIYDKNILKVANKHDLDIYFNFWIPDDIHHNTDDKEELLRKIVASVEELKSNPDIVAWNIGGHGIHSLPQYYFKPLLYYKQKEYLEWLQKLVVSIKTMDPTRPVSIDLYVQHDYDNIISLLGNHVPDLDSYGMVLSADTNSLKSLAQRQPIEHVSSVNPSDLKTLTNLNGFLANWQDEYLKNYASTDGLKDRWGRNKTDYFKVKANWGGSRLNLAPRAVKILLPAQTTFPKSNLTYRAIVKNSNRWILATKLKNFEFRWVLGRTDPYGNVLTTEDLGSGAEVTFSIPDAPERHKIILYAKEHKMVQIVESKLSTPLY